ncbi:MAG: hypothetical protein ACTSRU_18755 [Candidatus Hodarchaeales archaeon]
MSFKYEKRFLEKESYDDREVKAAVRKVAEQIPEIGFPLVLNHINPQWGIDLLAEHDETIGVEVERGGPVYGHWIDAKYPWVSRYDFKTLNMPDRKIHYWEEYFKWKAWLDEVHNPSYMKNLFVRTDYFFNQFCVVGFDTINNPEKSLRKRYKVSNNSRIEGWVNWKYENVKTFNRIDGTIVLETEDPATHLPEISDEERAWLFSEWQRIRAEYYKEKKEMKKLKEETEKVRKADILEKYGKKLNIAQRRIIARETVPLYAMGAGGKFDLDALGIPQFEKQKEEYYKTHAKVNY